MCRNKTAALVFLIAISFSGCSSKEIDMPEKPKDVYVYETKGEAKPFDILKTVNEIEPYSDEKTILAYDDTAYFAGENTTGGKILISENRSLYDIDGIVEYQMVKTMDGSLKFGSVYFFSPNISVAEYKELVTKIGNDLGVLFPLFIQRYSNTEYIMPEPLDDRFDDQAVYIEAKDADMSITTGDTNPFEKTNYLFYAMIKGYDYEGGEHPYNHSLENPPEYGQDGIIYNDLVISICFPGER